MDRAAVLSHRKDKDEFFKRSPHSPIVDRASFRGLSYFDHDPAFAVHARWSPAPAPRHVAIGTSTGDVKAYLEGGKLEFDVEGRAQSLVGYIGEARSDELFIPFRDSTSGVETYGAGRYLEVELPRGDKARVDFNLAYNPYCAYSEAWSCPLPPRENWLAAAIRAGEKSFHGD